MINSQQLQFARYVGTAKNGLSITAPSGRVYNFTPNEFIVIDYVDKVYLSTYRTPKTWKNNNVGCPSCEEGGQKVIYTDEEWCAWHGQDLGRHREYWKNYHNI